MNTRNLNAKVKAVNAVNKLCNQYSDTLREFFKPYIGKQIFKKEGDLMQKIRDALPKMPSDTRQNIWFSKSSYTLQFGVRASAPDDDGHGCTSHEATIYIGKMDGGVLVSLMDYQTRRTDYSFEGIVALRKDCEDKKKAYEDAKDKLWPFGE